MSNNNNLDNNSHINYSVFPNNLEQLSAEEIAKYIEFHNNLYWNEGAPVISDSEYDLLIRQLQKLVPYHHLLTEIQTPTVASNGKVKHAIAMLSLDKAYSLTEVLEWATKNARSKNEMFLIQPKYDGISANYAAGILATRGDGEYGENITDKLPLITLDSATGQHQKISKDVRGEIVIRDDEFTELFSKIHKKDGKFYKNSRNAVAGIMGLKEISEIQAQMQQLKTTITLVDYDYISYQVSFKNLTQKWDKIIAEIEALPYPLDGIVIKYADTKYSNSLGVTAHHPRGQIAFKFTNIQKESKLINVEWSFGKNCLTPVAQIEPIDIGGITISHASLHNYKNCIDKDIKINDKVIVERAGDVIPYIVEAIPGNNRQDFMIKECPSCASKLEIIGPELCCLNKDCFEIKLKRLTAAVKSIGIERLGEPNVRRMMEKLNVTSLKDIFELQITDILKLEGFKEKSSANLYGEIQTARNVADFQVLAALNINGIGKNVAKMILTEYTLAELRTLDEETLTAINGIGPERAKILVEELKLQGDFIDELIDAINMIQTKGAENTNANLQQKTICFTGKMPKKRKFYEDIATQHNLHPTSTVNKDLNILVAVNISGNSSKLTKARKHGAQIISLDDWLSSLNDSKVTADAIHIEAEAEKQNHKNKIDKTIETANYISNDDLFNEPKDEIAEPIQEEREQMQSLDSLNQDDLFGF
ncbi:helix-hairpin-helix domain-containing protein [Lentisphaerota bacterium WC36G]|nr:hypothetical protein LJT99_03060 [Lentisphaerae bacterium WC36]